MSLRWRRVAAYVITVTLTLAIVAFAPPQTALAAPAIDQEQPTIDTSATFSFIIGGSTQQTLAQTVTAGAIGDLVQVDLPVACPSTESLVLDIRDVASGGEPGSTWLSTTTIPGTALPPFPAGGITFRAITLATPVPVTPGMQFAIVLSTSATTTNCSLFPGPVGDSYAGGSAYTDSVNHSNWLCACDFANAREDHPFKTWVETPAPPGADVSITKTLYNPGSLNVFAATPQLYQLTISNAGPADATGVTVIDTLPGNVTYVDGHSSCTHNAGTVTCGLGALAAGSTVSIFLQVSFGNAGSYTNGATVSANEPDPDTSNNSASHTQQVLPTADLSINELDASVIVSPSAASPGETVTYDSTLKNLGPDATGNVTLIQTIPLGSTFVSISSPHTTICGTTGTADEYGCSFSSVPVGETRTMTVTITAPTMAQGIDSSFVVAHVVPPLILDPNSWNDTVTVTTWVIDETLQQTVSAGDTVGTDTENDGATQDDPIETTVTSPASGTVTIHERPASGLTSGDWTLIAAEVVISAPAGTTSNPIWLTFRIDESFLGQYDASTVEVIRNGDYNNPVPACTSPVAPTLPSSTDPISPDPCVYSRQTLADGDVEIVVLTSQASVWNFAVHDPFEFGGFLTPMTSTLKAGAALPVRFQLYLDGAIFSDRALRVIRSLASRPASCETGAALGGAVPANVIGGGLHFDEATSTYSVVWKTERAWAGSCRELVLELIDGSEHTALLRLR